MGKKQPSATYRGFRTAGIRLTEEPLPHLYSHRTERIAEMLWAIHQFDKAHLVMLVEEGLIPFADGIALLRAFRAMEAEGMEQARFAAQGGVHSGEQYMIRRLGEAIGGRVHLGRSTGDLDEVARRLAMRKHLLEVLPLIDGFRRTLLRRAEEHAETVMPGYTQGQNGQTTTFGHWLSMWAVVLARDVARLRAFYERLDLSPAGAAIMTGSDFPLNRHRTAELLGFAAPLPHTMDAILSHDLELEAASLLAILGSNIGRLGDDLMLWSSAEFAMIDVPDRFCGTSSIMMQKKNPVAPQEMKALAAEAVGSAMTAFMVEKGATGLPILERRTSERSLWSVLAATQRRLRDAEALVGALIVDATRMRELAASHWAQAADLAGALVREKGLAWRSAHQIVGILVRHSVERGIPPLATTPEMLDEAAVEYMDEPVGLSADAIARALDPVQGVARRTLYGGPAPAAARRELEAFRRALAADEAWVEAAAARHAAGSARLEAAIDALLRRADA